MLAVVRAAAVLGIRAFPVRVEVDLQPGLPALSTVGLPDESVRESRDRVRSAVLNSGFPFPDGRVTVNLAPADLRKEGSLFDLPIAVAILAAGGRVNPDSCRDLVLLGELSLDGGLKPVRGALPVALGAREWGAAGVVLPPGNAPEAALVPGVAAYAAPSLAAAVGFLNGDDAIAPHAGGSPPSGAAAEDPHDLADVRGQEFARRAVEIAAAGGHNLLMVGSPGSGKTMLARCLPGILPAMEFEEALEVTRVHSVAGLVSPESPLVARRPFRAPHHTVSYAGLVGGGAHPRPGEVSLAHRGVLFLDELPEFPRRVLEVLRQPLEDGEVSIARAALTLTYPARFSLAAAMNPCPCGYAGDRARECRCPPREVARYRERISGPLLDRIDLHVEMLPLEYRDLAGAAGGERSAAVRGRVSAARRVQAARLRGAGGGCNAGMGAAPLRAHCSPDAEGARLLEGAMRGMGLSARGYAKVLRVARTIADLAGEPRVRAPHVAEAIQYRALDRGRS